MPTVEIPSRYRFPLRGAAVVRVDGRTVRECVDSIEREHPGFRELVLDPRGDLARFVSLCRNGESMARDALDDELAPDDVVTILASAAGG